MKEPPDRSKEPAPALTVVPIVGAVERPRPPAHLTPDQAAIWNRVVASRQAGWFGQETHGILEAYCVHLSEARKLDSLLNECSLDWMRKAQPVDLAWRERLVKEREMHTRALTSLATKMRLTQSSVVRQDSAANRPVTQDRPWET